MRHSQPKSPQCDNTAGLSICSVCVYARVRGWCHSCWQPCCIDLTAVPWNWRSAGGMQLEAEAPQAPAAAAAAGADVWVDVNVCDWISALQLYIIIDLSIDENHHNYWRCLWVEHHWCLCPWKKFDLLELLGLDLTKQVQYVLVCISVDIFFTCTGILNYKESSNWL